MTQYVASISYGKDSLAMLHVIKDVLHLPLDRIITVEVWATDNIQADLPPMVAFKDHADRVIKERWGINVERVCAMKDGEKLTYEKYFHHVPKRKNGSPSFIGKVTGFPVQRKPWCNDKLKANILDTAANNGAMQSEHLGFPTRRVPWCNSGLKRDVLTKDILSGGNKADVIQYFGIAADEPSRIERHGEKRTCGCHLLRLDGRKQCAASGVSRMSSCHQYILRLPAVGAGSVIISL